MADWLIIRGMRKLVINSRRSLDAVHGYQKYRIQLWESYGCRVTVNTDDVTTYKGCKSLLIESVAIGPIGGIFNLAAVLYDGILDNQTTERFSKCVAPKADATFHLDQLSRLLCPQLEHFVVFSSASCGRGNAGQSNYGLANAIMERIIEQRIKHKLPGKAIQWGAINDVGLLAEMFGDKLMDTEIAGTLPQRISHCLRALDTLLLAPDPVVSSMVLADKQYEGDSGPDNKLSLVNSVLKVMGIRDLKTISPYATLAELGMDSLMSVEIKQILEREFDVFLTSEELRMMTFGKFQELSKTSGDGWQTQEKQRDDIYGFNFLFRNFGNEHTSEHPLLEMVTKNEPQKAGAALIIPGKFLHSFPSHFN